MWGGAAVYFTALSELRIQSSYQLPFRSTAQVFTTYLEPISPCDGESRITESGNRQAPRLQLRLAHYLIKLYSTSLQSTEELSHRQDFKNANHAAALQAALSFYLLRNLFLPAVFQFVCPVLLAMHHVGPK